MKKTFLQRTMGPLAVVVLGLAGAFGTMSMSSNTSAPLDQRGYRYVDALHPCVQDIMCTTKIGDVCKTTSFQTLWGLENENSCTTPLYKKQ